jgi:chitinase
MRTKRLFAAALALSIAILSGCAMREAGKSLPRMEDWPDQGLVIAYAPVWAGLETILDVADKGVLTHVNVSFLNPEADGSLPEIKGAKELIEAAHDLGIKVFISLGGGETSTEGKLTRLWRKLLAGKRKNALAAGIVAYARERGYDGIDVDLEGASIGPGYEAFVLALDAARSEPSVKVHGWLGLTAALPGDLGDSDVTRKALDAYDWINVMAYDLSGPWDLENPGPHSPYSYAESSLERFTARGVPRQRLVLGIPLYGYRLGPGKGDREYAWSEILATWPRFADDDEIKLDGSRGSIYFNGRATVRAKAVLARGNAWGVMFWHLGNDAEGKDSLIRIAAEALRN